MATKGFFYAHMGWLLAPYPTFKDKRKLEAFARDILADPVLQIMSKVWFMITLQISLSLLLFFLGGVSWFLWGICLRLVVCYHTTWFVNSAAHFFGYQNFTTSDRARNNWWVAILSWGEGWHNNHHAYPGSAKTGYRWWEIDVTYYVIAFLKTVRCAHHVNITHPDKKNFKPPKKTGYDAILCGSHKSSTSP